MIDPRKNIIKERLKPVKRIVAVSGGKGGIGKSVTSTLLALILKNEGKKVGLLDLDFTSPSTHIILGEERLSFPEEEKGIIPLNVSGLSYLSIVSYTKDNPTPLRGEDVSNAILELFAITRWEELDYLIMDLPPGIGDVLLELLRITDKVEFLLVTTPSILSWQTFIKVANLLQKQKIPIIGAILNMSNNSHTVLFEKKIQDAGIKYLGKLNFDPELEEKLGNPELLLSSALAKNFSQIIKNIL